MSQEDYINIITFFGSLCSVLQIIVFVLIFITFIVWLDKSREKEYLENLKRNIVCEYCEQKVTVQFYLEGYTVLTDDFVNTGYSGNCPNCHKLIFINDLPKKQEKK